MRLDSLAALEQQAQSVVGTFKVKDNPGGGGGSGTPFLGVAFGGAGGSGTLEESDLGLSRARGGG